MVVGVCTLNEHPGCSENTHVRTANFGMEKHVGATKENSKSISMTQYRQGYLWKEGMG